MEEGGYDANFIAEVPDDLKCVVCHFALKDPIQLGECGHRFCKICFEKMKDFSIQWDTVLCCPFDKIPIDVNQVQFSDKAAARNVLSLQVRCSYHDKGCEWINDLKSLQHHLSSECGYGEVTCTNEGCDMIVERRMLSQHIDTCTSVSVKASNDVVNTTWMEKLSIRMDDYERELKQKDKEISNFKQLVAEMKKEIEESKRQHQKQIKELNDDVLILSQRLNASEQLLWQVKELNPAMAVFEWKVTNYYYNSRVGDEYFSPKFYTSLNGYCCQLSLEWSGPSKGHLNVSFYVCRGRNDGQLGHLFNMNPVVGFIDRNGKSHLASEQFYSEDLRGCFLVPVGKERSNGCESRSFLKMPKLNNYIINDSIHLVCYISHVNPV